MQEIKKSRIVLASVLKPVNDIRMFEKLGLTLATGYETHIIGFPARTNVTKDVTFHPLKPFSRISLQRLITPWIIFRKILALRPNLIIITTHELLFPAVVAKWITGSKLIYDVQENYSRNILYTNTFPKVLRPFLVVWVKLKEWISRPFVDHYLLAEVFYQEEMFFPKGRFTVIENKLKKSVPVSFEKRTDRIQLIFSGTLAESTGVYIAIDLATALHRVDTRIRLVIIGYAPLHDTYEKLRVIAREKTFITLMGGDKIVPHDDILRTIAASDFGIISYPPNPSTANATPTKLYEYLGHKLPILLIDNPRWVEQCAAYPAAIVFSRGSFHAPTLLTAMQNTRFYQVAPDDVWWESESQKLSQLVETML